MFVVISYLLDKEAVKGVPRMEGIKIRDIVKLIESRGFQLKRQTGSHLIFNKHNHPMNVSVPITGNRTLPIGIINSIARQMGMSLPEFSIQFARMMGYRGFEEDPSSAQSPAPSPNYGRHGIALR